MPEGGEEKWAVRGSMTEKKKRAEVPVANSGNQARQGQRPRFFAKRDDGDWR